MQRLDTGEQVRELAFSPDPAVLAVVGNSGALHLWDLAAGKNFRSWVGGPYRTAIGCAAFSPDGRFLAAVANVGFAVWDTADLARPLAHNQFGAARQLTFHPSGAYLAAGDSGAVRRWLPPAWEEAPGGWGLRRTRLYWSLDSFAFSADGSALAVAGRDAQKLDEPFDLSIHDAHVGEVWHEHRVEGNPPASLAVTPDGRHVLGTQGTAIRIWEAATGREVRACKGGRRHHHRLALSPDGQLVAAVNTEDVVRVWDVASGKEVGRYDFGLGKLIVVAFAPDGLRAAVGGAGGVAVWDVG